MFADQHYRLVTVFISEKFYTGNTNTITQHCGFKKQNYEWTTHIAKSLKLNC